MLQLVKVKKAFLMRPVIKFIYSFFTIFSIMLCVTFYVIFYANIWFVPTQDNIINNINSENSNFIDDLGTNDNSNTHNYGEINPPSFQTYQNLYEIYSLNNDTVGWITVPNTNISYPVVQSVDNEFYLRRDYKNKKYSFLGSIFSDFRNSGTNRNDLSKNYVLYGHNISVSHDVTNGEMFNQLLRFKDLSFAQETQYINFSTFEDDMTWEIFACFYTDVDFYYIDVNPNEESFANIIEEAKLRSEYIYSVDVTSEDKILTLSTCAYKYDTKEQQRFVVMARLVPDGNNIVQKEIQQNESPKLPSFVS